MKENCKLSHTLTHIKSICFVSMININGKNVITQKKMNKAKTQTLTWGQFI